MGLAISLVSTVEEKVWYCSKKGYKPWLNPTAQDVKTQEEGGHTIWYNEQQLLKVGKTLLPPALLTPKTRQETAGLGVCEETLQSLHIAVTIKG